VTVAILVAVCLAVETARHVKLPPPVVLYAALIASLVLTWLDPAGRPAHPADRGAVLVERGAGLRPCSSRT
jgi:hypothetical protein